jgi:hypothetical protein
MEIIDKKQEENIAKILTKMSSLFKQVGLDDLLEKSENVLKKYHKSKMQVNED